SLLPSFGIGCFGDRNRSRTAPCSPISPAYITAIRSHILATMPRLWVTNISATPLSCWMSFRTSRYWAWIVTSRLVVGRRLVRDDQLRSSRHGDGADNPLKHAAAHPMRILAGIQPAELLLLVWRVSRGTSRRRCQLHVG